MKKYLNRLICFVALAVNTALADSVDSVRAAGEIYLQSFSHEMAEDNVGIVDPEKERYISWFYQLFGRYKDSTGIKLTFRTREVLVQILSMQISQVSRPVKTSADIFRDSRVLGDRESKTSSMLDSLFPGYTLSGEVLRALMLAQPTSDVEELHRQQSIIRKMMQASTRYETLEYTLQQLKPLEPAVIALFDRSDIIYSPEIQELVQYYDYRSVYRTIYDQLESRFWQGTGVLFQILNTAAILSLLTEPFFNQHYCSCKFFSSLVFSTLSLGFQFYARAIYAYLKDMLNQSELELYKTIRGRIDALSHYFREAQALQDIPGLPKELRITFNSREMELIKSFLSGSEWLMAKDPEAKTTYKEQALELLWYSLQLKQTIASVLYQSGKIDIYLAIARQMGADNDRSGSLTFVDFKGGRPYLAAKGLWNPSLDPRHVITNAITLEGNDVCLLDKMASPFVADSCDPDPIAPGRNLLLSGCNASGKSTLMRAITVNAIFLAQIFGIASAELFETGLFHGFYSHMDKYDQTGEFSSYEGELEHAMQILSLSKSLGIEENMLVCFDELFSNTDPEESLYVTNRVLNAMAKQLRTINIISSHYDVDTQGIDAENEFARVHMHVERVNDTLVRTYQLRQGQNMETNGLFHLMEKFRLFPDIHSELQQLVEDGSDDK